jgi:hypothetical protein
MRYILAALTFFAALYLNVSAQAERRIFILPNNSDGYGIDHCLATGAACGAAAATAYAARATSSRPRPTAGSNATRSPARSRPARPPAGARLR